MCEPKDMDDPFLEIIGLLNDMNEFIGWRDYINWYKPYLWEVMFYALKILIQLNY